jgi:hypothetical protein
MQNNQKKKTAYLLLCIFVLLKQLIKIVPMTKLSVNINKIATLRNARGSNVDLLK